MNQNRFKFRYLDKTTNLMYNVVLFDIESNYAQVSHFDDKEAPIEEVKLSDGILMQAIGSCDKNKKLIFEGDVIKGNVSKMQGNVCQGLQGMLGKEIVGYVTYSNSYAQFYFTTDSITYLDLLLGIRDKEVIGNIYQNYELLNN